jgi:hypothetical protein
MILAMGFLERLELFFGSGEDQLVVDLKDHLRLVMAFGEEVVDLDHRDLDEVGGAALDRGVKGRPPGGFPLRVVGVVDIAQIAAASEHRGDVAFGFGVMDGAR